MNTPTNPAELWLVRHGETDWNRHGLYQGQTDIPLNAAGLAQAHAAAERLALSGRRFAALYSSPLARARQTAEAAAARLGLSVLLDERLVEIHQGAWQGKNYAQVVAEFGGLLRAAEASPLDARAPGGESTAEVAARMSAAAADIARAHPGEAVLVFSHGFALAVLACLARGIPLEQVYEHIPSNARAEVIRWPSPLTLPDAPRGPAAR